MTKHVSPQMLTEATVAALLQQVDAEIARKALEVIGRDRVLVGCGCASPPQEIT